MHHKSNVYVITGGAGGMGKAAARRLGKWGTVLLSDVDSARLEQAAAQLRSESLHIETQVSDISDKESVRSLAKTAASLGRLSGLAHTAGLSPTMANWKRIFEVDLIGTALLLEGFLPLAEAGTAAVCVASNSGYLIKPEPAAEAILSEPLNPDFLKRIEPLLDTGGSAGAYTFAKRGVMILCEVLAPAWGKRGARIVSVSPGIIDTPMSKQEFETQPLMKSMVEMTPLQRIGKPDEIAAAIEFLLSDGASFITGTDLRIDGGVMSVLLRSGLA